MLKLRDYQIEIALQLKGIISNYKIAYLVGEVRCGKTLMALQACKELEYNNVLFITKKKAISSIESDYEKFNFTYKLTVTNYESAHKIESKDFDIVIYDEAHVLSGFPKPSVRTKLLKSMFSNLPCIFLSGTPAIESGSQWYHQMFVSLNSPFKKYINFYKWAVDFVEVKKIDFGYGHPASDYSNANTEKILKELNHLIIRFTQKQAGFETVINEKILYCDMKPVIKSLAKRLINDRVIEGATDVILADTAVKLQNKVHQIYNGSCIGESGKVLLLDSSKAEFIRSSFENKKIAIMYFYKGELELIKSVFKESLTTELEEFNTTDKNIAIQQSSTEGVNLSKADYLIYYNFGFSGKNYVQSRDRLSQLERKTNDVYFVFERNGISDKIYNAVKNKKDYNTRLFKNDFL